MSAIHHLTHLIGNLLAAVAVAGFAVLAAGRLTGALPASAASLVLLIVAFAVAAVLLLLGAERILRR